MSTEQTFEPGPDTVRTLRDAFGRFATGVTVVTTQTPDGPAGFTANSFTSLSLDPPLVIWSPAQASSRFALFAGAAYFAIHVLAEEEAHLCNRFIRGGAGFEGLAFDHSPEGIPVLAGTLARFDCACHATHPGGDHLIVVGRVIRARARSGGPLVFSQGLFGGFTPPDASGTA